jgi:uncharacterized protein with NAD-binding domain and iron-sulfur cluster
MSKEKIAILGGGVGAMTTAFEITNSPGWSDKYEITVYQMGWRLGGKGASGRNLESGKGDRIEEHGLHIWMGFYENAFRAIRQAYAECNEFRLTPDSPFTSWDKAFSPVDLIVLTERFGDEWKLWQMLWPPNDLAPGVNAPDTPTTTWQCVLLLIKRALEEMDTMAKSSHVKVKAFRWLISEALAEGLGKGCLLALWPFVLPPEAGKTAPKPGVWSKLRRKLNAKPPATMLHKIHAEAQELPTDIESHSDQAHPEIVEAIDTFRNAVYRAMDDDAESGWEEHDNLRRHLIVIDAALTIARGVLADRVFERGFESIDDRTFTEWMRDHGARYPESVLTRGMYDSSFAYRDGDPEKPDFAAGTTLYGALRLMFTYKGSIMWHMNAGMGDTIFSPLYLVLKQRGVKFEFFNKVTSVNLTEDHTKVGSIDIDVQLKVKAKEAVRRKAGQKRDEDYDPAIQAGYDPLFTVKGVPCWPAEPFYDQLCTDEDGKKKRKPINPNVESWWTDLEPACRRTLVLGEDFDSVVMGISLGALPYICPHIIATSTKWREMVEHVRTVRTQGLQIWLNRTRTEMGWKSPYRDSVPLLCAYYEPFDTWADMTHLVSRENWPAAENVRSLSYFCNTAQNDPNQAPFSDPGYPARQSEIVENRAREFMEHRLRPIWPEFDWNAVVSQFTRINIDPSEQYVQTVAGSTRHRLRSWESGYDNLVLAGDWTRTDVNIGCVEAATMSGMMAAHAVCGYPKTIFGAFGRELPLDKNDTGVMDALESHLLGRNR